MFRGRNSPPKRNSDLGHGPGGLDAKNDPSKARRSTFEALKPITERIRQYDHYRRKLEREGGTVRDVRAVTELLKRDVVLIDRYEEKRVVTLCDQQSLRMAVQSIGNWDARIAVRQLNSQMPVYYLCRVRWDTWYQYSIIVEDLYRSPGFPGTDERFMMLMNGGHEQHFLCLSPFREAAAARISSGEPTEWAIDEALYNVGRHVFRAAWHEDQRVGIMTAIHFGLSQFRQAVELLYLCLGGELCELRQALDNSMHDFFEKVYPQAAIQAFLEKLKCMDGRALNAVPRTALNLYARLSKEFGRFVQTPALWGDRCIKTPLYKLLFANLNRLERVSPKLIDQPEVRQASYQLEEAATAVIKRVLEFH